MSWQLEFEETILKSAQYHDLIADIRQALNRDAAQ
jgi:hypothetical protein